MTTKTKFVEEINSSRRRNNMSASYNEYLARAKTLKAEHNADRVILANGQSRKFYPAFGANSNIGFVITNCRAVHGIKGYENTFHPTRVGATAHVP